MIPKTIHYVWLSGDEKPLRIQQCIDSWRRVMPGYEIVEWDMERVRNEVPMILWLEQTIAAHVWAFATDYLRFWILYNHGGIYLDSDVRVIAPFDRFLVHGGFSGIEWVESFARNEQYWDCGINIEAAILGAEKGHPLLKRMMDYYRNRTFRRKDTFDTLGLPQIMSQVLVPAGFRQERGVHQVLEGDFHIYPEDVFSTQSGVVSDYRITENTVAIHLVSGSWLNAEEMRVDLPDILANWASSTKKYGRKIWEDVFVLAVRGRTEEEKRR